MSLTDGKHCHCDGKGIHQGCKFQADHVTFVCLFLLLVFVGSAVVGASHGGGVFLCDA